MTHGYPIEAPEQDPDLAEQLLAAQRDGLALVLRDLGNEVNLSLQEQEKALAKVTNALKRRIQTSLRGQVTALIPVMDAIHGSVASSLAEQQAALSVLMDQAPPPSSGPNAPPRYFKCLTGDPVQGPDGRWGCLYNGTVHYDDPSTGQAVGMWVYDSPGGPGALLPDIPGGPDPKLPPPPLGGGEGPPLPYGPPQQYPIPGNGDEDEGPPEPDEKQPPPPMCCPPCPTPKEPVYGPGGEGPGSLGGGTGGNGGVSLPAKGGGGGASAVQPPLCPPALGYALSDCGIDYWREGATSLIATEAVQAMLALSDWRELLMPGISGPADQPLFPLGLDPFSLADDEGGVGFIDTGGKQ